MNNDIILPGDILVVNNGCLLVNGKPYVVNKPEGRLIGIDERGNLVTRIEGVDTSWERRDIEGYWA